VVLRFLFGFTLFNPFLTSTLPLPEHLSGPRTGRGLYLRIVTLSELSCLDGVAIVFHRKLE
jgi:hypothetical protein